jgi:mannitol/fructose-specific phosphotransferase system IIA component (Ntr-type)
LNQPVVSGAQENDPVSLIFALCTPDPDQHIELLGDFALIMSDPEIVNSLLKASAESVIQEILQS